MNQFILLAEAGAEAGGFNPIVVLILQLGFLGLLMYFIIFRPQKKQRKQMEEMISNLEIGDSVLTSSGFYGVVIDVMEEVVIVEFGNNKNCRIPMKKDAISELEKVGSDKE